MPSAGPRSPPGRIRSHWPGPVRPSGFPSPGISDRPAGTGVFPHRPGGTVRPDAGRAPARPGPYKVSHLYKRFRRCIGRACGMDPYISIRGRPGGSPPPCGRVRQADTRWPAAPVNPARSRPAPWGMTVTAGCGRRRWRCTIRRDARDRPAARCATGYARSATASPARWASAPPHGRRRRGTGGSAGPPTPGRRTLGGWCATTASRSSPASASTGRTRMSRRWRQTGWRTTGRPDTPSDPRRPTPTSERNTPGTATAARAGPRRWRTAGGRRSTTWTAVRWERPQNLRRRRGHGPDREGIRTLRPHRRAGPPPHRWHGTAWMDGMGEDLPVILPAGAGRKAACRPPQDPGVTMEHVPEPHHGATIDHSRLQTTEGLPETGGGGSGSAGGSGAAGDLKKTPCLRRRDRGPGLRPDRVRPGAAGDARHRGLPGEGHRPAPHHAGTAGPLGRGEAAGRSGARHPDIRPRPGAPRRPASGPAAAAAGDGKGPAGTREAEPGHPGPRRPRKAEAGMG